MQKERKENQEIISMEEYLCKRQKIRETEEKGVKRTREKSPAWMLAELYMC